MFIVDSRIDVRRKISMKLFMNSYSVEKTWRKSGDEVLKANAILPFIHSHTPVGGEFFFYPKI